MYNLILGQDNGKIRLQIFALILPVIHPQFVAAQPNVKLILHVRCFNAAIEFYKITR